MAFIGSAWATHFIGCRAAGVALLAPTKGLLMTGLVTLWGARLAGYLFYRVLVVGEDARLRQVTLRHGGAGQHDHSDTIMIPCPSGVSDSLSLPSKVSKNAFAPFSLSLRVCVRASMCDRLCLDQDL